MRVPLQWLADFVDLEIPVEELAERLTMSGLKVEAIERLGVDWQDVVVGEIIEVEPHPSSRNPLFVAKVSLGNRAITIVTGAPNVHAGAKVPAVMVGGLLPHGPQGAPIVIEAKPMAGITSEGMLASERELGISDEHSGILILPPDAPVGAHLKSVLGDDVLDIETNPNRPDTLSMIGIAREVAALTEQQLKPLKLDEDTDNVERFDEESFDISVAEPELCPRYSALRIEGITQTATPFWMTSRLEAAGMRSIALLVDITNYVMLETGQPMHAFDASRLKGGEIIVRRAKSREHLKTLDGTERTLTSNDLVIADAKRPVAIAGVMGGEDTEITDRTSSILVESANFEGLGVRRTAQKLGLRTESSSRFEKGLPPENTVLGLRRFLQLLADATDHPVRAPRITDVWTGRRPPKTVTMPMRDLHRLVGLTIPLSTASEALSLLEFNVKEEFEAITVQVPPWRKVDIERSADLVEEVARLVGYDEVPSSLPKQTMEPPVALPELYWEGLVRERLMAAGVNEATTHSLTSPSNMARLLAEDADKTALDSPELWGNLIPNAAGVYEREALPVPLRLQNPATQDRQVLRLTLLPALLDTVARNLKETEDHVAFFEIDRTFFAKPEDLPYERRTLSLALSGRREPLSWQNPSPENFTFYDIKGLLTAVLELLHIGDWRVEARPHPSLHPGRSATLELNGHHVAILGELHPIVAERFEIEGWRVQVAEVDLDALFAVASEDHVFRPLPRFPAAHRDIAIVVNKDLPASEIGRVIRSQGDDLLESARIFDVYEGEPLPPGTKSIAVSMDFRAPGATLTQDQVNEVMQRIVQALTTDLGASLRT